MKIRLVVLGLFCSLLCLQETQARPLKLGTLAPQGSNWYTFLKDVAQKWKDNTGQPVTIYAQGSIASDESQIVDKMQEENSQLQAAAISTVGLRLIAPETLVLDLPNLVHTQAERMYLLEKLGPTLKQILSDKGFIVLAWSEIGFTYFFTNEPRTTVQSLKEARLFFWDNDDTNKTVWQEAGFKNLRKGNMLKASQEIDNGGINTIIYTNTLASLISQLPKPNLNYQINFPFSSFTGAVIVKKSIWDELTEDQRNKISSFCKQKEKEIFDLALKDEDRYLQIMKKKGLNIVEFPAEQKKEWDKLMNNTYEKLKSVSKGNPMAIPAGIIDQAVTLVKKYRAEHPQK